MIRPCNSPTRSGENSSNERVTARSAQAVYIRKLDMMIKPTAILVIITALFSSVAFSAQQMHSVEFGEWHCSLALPKDWSLVQAQEVRGMTVRTYAKKVGKLYPTLSAVFEHTSIKTPVEYSIAKRLTLSFQVDHVFTSENGFTDIQSAIGYEGHLTTPNSEAHAVVILHALDAERNVGAQFIFEAPSDLMPTLRAEFMSILKTIRFTK